MNWIEEKKIKIGREKWFLESFRRFNSLMSSGDRFQTLSWGDRYPCYYDNTKDIGFDSHYIYHTAWAARILANINPKSHIDISSVLYFSTIISAFIPTEFYDYRNVNVRLSNFRSKRGDLLSLPFKSNSVRSLSCMHTLEHIGLGRYGDNLDPDGDLKSASELSRVLSKDGNLLIVVPVGKPRILFNAHRVYAYKYVIDMFKGLRLLDFSLIPDNYKKYGIVFNPSQRVVDKQFYGCGCFHFKNEK